LPPAPARSHAPASPARPRACTGRLASSGPAPRSPCRGTGTCPPAAFHPSYSAVASCPVPARLKMYTYQVKLITDVCVSNPLLLYGVLLSLLSFEFKKTKKQKTKKRSKNIYLKLQSNLVFIGSLTLLPP
jgi:hypothetical protein